MQRIREIENASFTPLVLSATGGLAVEATVFYKRLASLLAMKWDQPYSSTLSWLRCHLNFSLLRSAIQCIRGARSSIGQAIKAPPPMDLAMSENCKSTELSIHIVIIFASFYSVPSNLCSLKKPSMLAHAHQGI